jgi:hypothetical protein
MNKEERTSETIWGYKRNGEVFVTPSYHLAVDRGISDTPTLIYHRDYD